MNVGELKQLCDTLPDTAQVLIEVPNGGLPYTVHRGMALGQSTDDPGLVLWAARRFE